MTENPFDKACRYLLKLEPVAMLAWLLNVAASVFQFIRWIDARRLPFPGTPDRICDTVAHIERLDDNHRPWALIAEFNIEPDPLMFGRMLAYLGLLWMEEKPSKERGDRFHLGAIQVNLTGMGDCSRSFDWPDAGLRTDLRVREINLSTLVAANVLQAIADQTAPRTVLPWIPLMQGGSDSGIIERWKELASAEPNAQRRADFGGLVLVFAEAANCWDVWKLALKEWNMIESKQVKEWQDQARKEGRQEGRREGRLETLLEFLQDKFGNLPADLPAHLQSIDDGNVLRQLLLKAVHAGSLEDFQRQIPNGSK